MKTQKIYICILLIIALILVNLTGIIIYFDFDGGMLEYYKDVDQRRIQLLCETDHQALLDACIELSRKIETGELQAGWYSIRRHPDPKVSEFPKVILDLDPSVVIIHPNGKITIEMAGGPYHFGITTTSHGDRELIPGLLYYDDNYQEDPNYGQEIDRLIQKNKYLDNSAKSESQWRINMRSATMAY